MRPLTENEQNTVAAGANFFNVLSGALFGGVIGGVTGLITAGPPGLVAGAVAGVYDGTASALVYEGAKGLADL